MIKDYVPGMYTSIKYIPKKREPPPPRMDIVFQERIVIKPLIDTILIDPGIQKVKQKVKHHK